MPSGQQYFVPRPDSPNRPSVLKLAWKGRLFPFVTDAGVFSRDGLDAGTRVMLEALPPLMPGRLLDLGCGWGAVGILTGACHPEAEVLMTDVNERALALAEQNAAANGVAARVFPSDGFSSIEGDFDWILTNPPIRSGKETVYRLFGEASGRLRASGTLFAVIRKRQGAESALRFLKGVFLSAEVIQRSGGYWVIRCSGGRPHAL